MKEQAPKELKILEDDRPELDEKSGVKRYFQKNFFIFLVDRSASMAGETIMTTVEALKLFIQSLPSGCMFDIISFGSTYTSMT
jgi:hypothetical protein